MANTTKIQRPTQAELLALDALHGALLQFGETERHDLVLRVRATLAYALTATLCTSAGAQVVLELLETDPEQGVIAAVEWLLEHPDEVGL